MRFRDTGREKTPGRRKLRTRRGGETWLYIDASAYHGLMETLQTPGGWDYPLWTSVAGHADAYLAITSSQNDDGSSYKLSEEFVVEDYTEGMSVMISYDEIDGEKIEREVTLGLTTAFDLHFRLRPTLRRIASELLRARRGIDLREERERRLELEKRVATIEGYVQSGKTANFTAVVAKAKERRR